MHKSFLFAQIRVVHFGKVIDGRGNAIVNALVIVDKDRIVKMGPEKDISIPAGAEKVVVDKTKN